MYWERSCSLSLGSCLLIKSAAMPCLNLLAGAAVSQRNLVWRHSSSDAALLFPIIAGPAMQSALLSLIVNGKRLEKSHSQKTNPSNQGWTQKCLVYIIWVKSSLSSHCLEMIDQRVFQNWYHCFNSETRGQFAGLQNMVTVSSPQFLNMMQLLRFIYSWFSDSTLLLYSRIHLDSEDSSFDLMWNFSLDPVGVNVVAL